MTELSEFIQKYESLIIEDGLSMKLKIDNVDSILFINIEERGRRKYSFYIDSRYIDYPVLDTEKFESIETMSNKIIKIVKSYKFCKYNNKFVNPDKIDYFNDLLNTFNNIDEETIEEHTCPICLENNGTMTLKCYHKLCYYCRIKMIKTDSKSKCPLCKSSSLYDTTNDILDDSVLITAELDIDSDSEYSDEEEEEEEEEINENEDMKQDEQMDTTEENNNEENTDNISENTENNNTILGHQEYKE